MIPVVTAANLIGGLSVSAYRARRATVLFNPREKRGPHAFEIALLPVIGLIRDSAIAFCVQSRRKSVASEPNTIDRPP